MIDRHVVEEFISDHGARIFRLPLEVLPEYWAYAHLVIHDDAVTLVDTGSGFGKSNDDLVAGLAAIQHNFGIRVGLASLHQIIITHGHIDHIGGLAYVLSHAPDVHIAAHELVRPVLTNYQHQFLKTQQAIARFLRIAGVPRNRLTTLLEMHSFGKQSFESVPMHCTLEDGGIFGSTFEVTHVPGHAPGLVMLQIDDVLLTADHILPNTSVVLAPEMIMSYTGVGHYLESLARAERRVGVRVALGGHECPMHNYYQEVRHARDNTIKKVNLVKDLCAEPRTIYEIACHVYDEMEGYGELLKLEQIGARVEYLHQRGLVLIDNLEGVEKRDQEAWRFLRAPQTQ